MIYSRSAKFHRTETSAEMAPKRNLYWFYTCLTSILLVVALLPIIGKTDFHNIALSFYPTTNNACAPFSLGTKNKVTLVIFLPAAQWQGQVILLVISQLAFCCLYFRYVIFSTSKF